MFWLEEEIGLHRHLKKSTYFEKQIRNMSIFSKYRTFLKSNVKDDSILTFQHRIDTKIGFLTCSFIRCKLNQPIFAQHTLRDL